MESRFMRDLPKTREPRTADIGDGLTENRCKGREKLPEGSGKNHRVRAKTCQQQRYGPFQNGNYFEIEQRSDRILGMFVI
jgi:hypothetical protein